MSSLEQGVQVTEHKAGSATYRGDVRPFAPTLVGPTTYGSWLCASDAVYDPETDTTRVTFVHTKPAVSL